MEQLRSNWGQKEKKIISSAHDLVIWISISAGYPQSVKPNPGPSVYLGKITKGFASKSPDNFLPTVISRVYTEKDSHIIS